MRKKGGFDPPARSGINEDHEGFQSFFRSTSAKSAMVGACRKVASGKLFLTSFSISAVMRTAKSEWPPSSKKLSRMPIALTFKTFDQICASDCSSGSRGDSEG